MESKTDWILCGATRDRILFRGPSTFTGLYRRPNVLAISSYCFWYISKKMKHYTVYSLLENCSTCFGCYLHRSSGAHTTVSTASGTCQTVTATCRYCGSAGTGSSVVWELYWSVLVRLLTQPHQNRSVLPSDFRLLLRIGIRGDLLPLPPYRVVIN